MAAEIPAIEVKRASFKNSLFLIFFLFFNLFITIGWIIFRTSIIVRNIYSEVLNIIQAIVINKLKNKKNIKNKIFLNDALLTSIAGISAAMKNTG